MRTKVIWKRTKSIISLLLVFSVMASLLVPFDIAVFADAPATGSNIHALLYKNGSKYTLVFQNDTAQDSSYGAYVETYNDFADRTYEESYPSTQGWTDYANNITRVVFRDKIQPKNTSGWFSHSGNFGNNTLVFENMKENLDMSQVICTFEMFKNCRAKVIDVSGFDTSNVKNMHDMFVGCTNVTVLDVSNWDVSKVGTGEKLNNQPAGFCGMFYNCQKVEVLDVSRWNTSNSQNIRGMFRACLNLKELDMSQWDLSQVRDAMNFCDSNNDATEMAIESIKLPAAGTTNNLTSALQMFRGCANLKSLNLSAFSFGVCSSTKQMFYNCKNLETITTNGGFRGLGWNGNGNRSVSKDQMFYNCNALTSLDLSGLNATNGTNTDMFYGMDSLMRIKLGEKFKGGAGVLTFPNWERVVPVDGGVNILTQDDLIGNFKKEFAGEWHVTDRIVLYGNRGTPNYQTLTGGTSTPANLTGITEPVRQGYVFDGWYPNREPDENGSWGDKLTQGVNPVTEIYYARWTPIKYTLILKGNGGLTTENSDTITTELYYDDYYPLSKNAFSRDGYILTHWNTRVNNTGVSYDAVDEISRLSEKNGATITLYAQWHDPDVTVTFDSDGGSEVPQKHYTLSGDEDTYFGELQESFKKDYTFTGWYYTEIINDEETEIKAEADTPLWDDVTLKAHWEPNPVITFDANGGNFTDSNTTTQKVVLYGSQIGTLPTPKKANSTFIGWFTAADGGTQINANTTMTSDATYHAHWGYKPVFHADGGTIRNLPDYPIQSNSQYTITTLPNVFRTGYTFDGWYYGERKLEGGETLELSQGNTIRAHWTQRNKITVTLRPNGGQITGDYTIPDPDTGDGTRLIYVYEGDSINELPAPKRDDYNFVGWYDENDKKYTVDDKFQEDITLTAHWEERNYTLTFVPGENATMFGSSTVKVAKNTPINELPGAIYQDTGNVEESASQYTLEGWYPNPDFTGTKLNTSDPVTENKTYYAHWVKNIVTSENGYKYSMYWKNSTASVVTNVDDRLTFHPNTKNNINAILYISFDSGDLELDAGTVKISVPKYAFKDWDGNLVGEANVKSSNILPYDPDSTSSTDDFYFGYVECDDHYELINNRPLKKNDQSYANIYYTVSPVDVPGGAIDEDGNYVRSIQYYDNTKYNVPITPSISVDKDTDGTAEYTESKDLYIELHTKIMTTQSKEMANVSFKWNSAWGEEPADADEYIYITWNLIERFTAATNQQFSFAWTEETVHDGSVVVNPPAETEVDIAERNQVTQQVVTKHSKAEVFDNVESNWATVENEAVVTENWKSGYTTYHRVSATAEIYWPNEGPSGLRSFTKRVPNYTNTSAHTITGGQEDIIDDNKSVKLTYNIVYSESTAPAGRATKADNELGYTAGERKYTITDGYNGSVLMSEGKGTNTNYSWSDPGEVLGENDYYFTALDITLREYDSSYLGENWMTPFEHTDRDAYKNIAVYYRIKGDTTFSLLKSFKPTQAVSHVDLPANTVEFKVEHTSSFFTTGITVTPEMYLNASDKVKNLVGDHMDDGYSTIVKNKSTLIIDEDDTQTTYTTEAGDAYPCVYELNISSTNLYTEKQCASKEKVVMDSITNTETMAAVISAWNRNDSGRLRRLRSGVFYDLLPVGYSVDRNSVFIILRTITGTTEKSSKKADNYDTALNSTTTRYQKLDSTYYNVEFVNNYQGSGQTMMIVTVRLPDNLTINQKYPNGVDVYYKMRTSYENVFARGEQIGNSVAFVNTSASQAKPELCYGPWGTIPAPYSNYYSSLDAEYKDNIAYAYELTNAKEPTAYSVSFRTAVKTDGKYSSNEVVGINSPYTYRLTYMQSNDTTAGNLVFYNVLENGMDELTPEWEGTFAGVDASAVSLYENNGEHCAPVIYYSNKSKDSFTDEDMDITNTKVWTTVRPDDSDVTAIAVDCSKTESGKPFLFTGSLVMNIYVNMLSPSDADINDAMTFNRVSYKAVSGDNQILGADKAVSSVVLHKQLPQFAKTALPESGTQEKPMGVVYQSVLTYDLTVTNPDPNMTLNDIVIKDTIPAGLVVNNAIQVKIGDNAAVNIDSSPRVDYTLSNNEFTATINYLSQNETIVFSIPATVNVDHGSFENTAQITMVNGATLSTPINSETTYHDVENMQVRILKVDSNHEPLQGATLRLLRVNNDSTTTQIGQDFVSTDSAIIFEDGIVAGTYRLEEVTPPADYKPAAPITFTVDSEGLTKVGDEYVTYVEMVDEPRYKVIFHENQPNHDDVIFRIYEPKDLNADKTITHFYDIPKWADDEYVFAGWYHNSGCTESDTPDSDVNTAADFESDAYAERDFDYHLYAKWIQVGTVEKDAKDENIISGYRGFGLAGVQIRPKTVKVKDPETGEYVDTQMYDPNHRDPGVPGEQYNDAIVATPEGLRFVTSLSESLLAGINGIEKISNASQEAKGFGVEYGYVVGTEQNINTFINHYKEKISDETAYTLQYNGENVNGKNTTLANSAPETDYRYISNVNCTSKQGAGTKNNNPGIALYDHRNFEDYRLYTLVVTYEGVDANNLDKKLDARAYIRYYDANGKLRVFYNTYKKNMYYGGCLCSFNQVSSIALSRQEVETGENP